MIENSSYFQELASHPMPEHVDDLCSSVRKKTNSSNLYPTAVNHRVVCATLFPSFGLRICSHFLSLMNLAHSCQVFQDDHFLFLSQDHKILRKLSGL